MSDITIVIQGPLHKHCIENVDNYLKFGKVVISCYDTDDLSILPKDKDLTVILSKYLNMEAYNNCNLFYQCYTSLGGLAYAETKYVIKCRCDEKYSDISKLVEKVYSNPDKLITNNVAFPRTAAQPLHPSDHMIGGKLSSLVDMFSMTAQFCINYKDYRGNFDGSVIGLDWLNGMMPEQLLCLFYLIKKGHSIHLLNKDHSVETLTKIMKENYDVVPVQELGDVVHSINTKDGRVFRIGTEGLYGYPHESITSMSDL